jgi:hypothetical protein
MMDDKRIDIENTDFVGGMLSGSLKSAMADDDDFKVFDWHKAAQILRDERPNYAYAGLAEDWNNTSGLIFRDGKVVLEDDTYTYLASAWATPGILLPGESGVIPCYLLPSENDQNWDSETYWPQSALNILLAPQLEGSNPKIIDGEFEVIDEE